MNKEELEKIVDECDSRRDICDRIYGYANSKSYKKVDDLLEKYSIDISHYKNNRKIVYETIIKECPVCGKEFETKKGHKKEKVTCSKSCSNTYFRSGENHPNWKDGMSSNSFYAKLAYRNYEHKCDMCGFDKMYALEVHHIDLDHNNNNLENLVILCSNCHRGIHYGDLEYKRKV